MIEAMTNATPRPHVDPYWTKDDPKVHAELLAEGSHLSEADLVAETIRVAQVVQVVRGNPSWQSHAYLWKSFGAPKEFDGWASRSSGFVTPQSLAKYVIDDAPSQLHREAENTVKSYGAKRLIFNGSDHDGVADFHRGQISAEYLHGWAAWAVNPTTFFGKWSRDTPRPNKAAQMIARGEIGTDADRKALASACDLNAIKEDREAFTVWPKVTPNHPEEDPMHSVNAGAARMIAAVTYNHEAGSPADMAVCRKAAANALARTQLGVHYASSCLRGMRLGQELMLKLLPAKMAEVADADPKEVLARIKPFAVKF